MKLIFTFALFLLASCGKSDAQKCVDAQMKNWDGENPGARSAPDKSGRDDFEAWAWRQCRGSQAAS
jgi:hypothetical protein